MTVEKTYITRAICPVCRAVMGEAEGPDANLPAMAAALLFGDARRAHGSISPTRKQSRERIHGWTTETRQK